MALAEATTAPIRVLHVDDEPGFGDLVALYLEREHDALDVTTATSAEDGLDRLAGTEVDCIVSDYDMPGMDGLELLETVRDSHPNLPFVLFTGRGSEEIASEAITGGVDEYLKKGNGTEQYTVLANRIGNLVAQHRAEHELATTTERLQTIYDNLPLVAFGLDADGTYTFSRGPALGGVDVPDGVVGESAPEIHAGTPFAEDIDRVLDGDACHEVRRFGSREFELWYRPVSETETPDSAIGVGIDVTDHLERQRTLETARARFRALTANARFSVVTIDEANVVQYANDAVEGMFGYTPEEMVGESLDRIVPERLEQTHFEAVTRYLREGERRLDWEWVELPARHRDGHEFPVGVSFGEYVDDDTHLFTGILRDISTRKARERELERQHEHLSTVTDAVRDLHGPLSVATEALTGDDRPDPDALADATAALDRMAAVVEHVRILAETATDELETTPFETVVEGS